MHWTALLKSWDTLLSAALLLQSRFDSCTGDSGILLGYHSIGRLPECLPLRCCLGFFSYTPLWPNWWFYAGHWLTIGWPPVASHYIPKWWKGLVHLLFLTSGILEKQIHIEKPSWETVTLYGLRRILSLSCTVNRINSGFSGSSPTGPTTYCQQSKWTILHINKDTTNANFTLGAWASSFLAWNIGAK